MAEEESLWLGDCVTEKKVHCGVCNALKTDIMIHCLTHTVSAASLLFSFAPFCFSSLPLSLFTPSFCIACAPCPLIILSSCHTASLMPTDSRTHAETLLPPSKCAVTHSRKLKRKHLHTHTYMNRSVVLFHIHEVLQTC